MRVGNRTNSSNDVVGATAVVVVVMIAEEGKQLSMVV